MASYTIKNLKESEDVAVKGGVSEMQEARFPWRDLDTEQTGLAHIVVDPGKRQPFGHHQKQAEEIYVVLAGSGRVKLDDDIKDVGRWTRSASPRRWTGRSRPARTASS